MERQRCWCCFGDGVVQSDWGRGYHGVCQECQGDGHLYYTIGGKEVSKADYEDYMCDDDD